MKVFFLISVLVLGTIGSTSGLQCYSCLSAYDTGCERHNTPNAEYLMECPLARNSESVSPVLELLKGKLAAKSGRAQVPYCLSGQVETNVVRACATMDEAYGDEPFCEEDIGVIACACFTDACNGPF